MVLQEVSNDLDDVSLNKDKEVISRNCGEILLQDATARWQPNSQEATLQNLSLDIKKGTLTAVVGLVGSGKVRLEKQKPYLFNTIKIVTMR